jgi:hypothetical protein
MRYDDSRNAVVDAVVDVVAVRPGRDRRAVTGGGQERTTRWDAA